LPNKEIKERVNPAEEEKDLMEALSVLNDDGESKADDPSRNNTTGDGKTVVDEEVTSLVDEEFRTMFMEEPRCFDSLLEVDDLIGEYEQRTGFCLIIRKSSQQGRTYFCASHIGCTFRARFGRHRGTDEIVLKANMTKVEHNGKKAPSTANGRAFKKRLKGKFDDVVSHVVNVQH
jgi:hypothetical protein